VWKALNTRLDESQLAAISHALAAQDVATRVKVRVFVWGGADPAAGARG
jgi:hypothetical protein